MKIHKLLIAVLVSFLLGVCVWSAQAQNLLSGWDNTGGTPYDAGWRVDGSVSVNWGALNASNNRFRTGVGSPANNGTDPMLYIINQDTKFGYPITPAGGKMYQLSGKAWRRNGGSGSVTFNFYLADNLLANSPVSQASLDISGNNIVSTINMRFATPPGFTNGYFLWDVHLNSGNWQDAGIWLLNMTEIGDACTVSFNTDGGNIIPNQYFLDGDYYTVNKPADPTKEGYIFKGWYADAGFTNEFEFKTLVQVNTTIYAKWDDLKGELIGLINEAGGLLSGGTAKGQAYLNAKIAEAQVVADNPSASPEIIAAAFETLTVAIASYKDASLSDLQVNSTGLPGFSPETYTYTYNIPLDASIPTVAATAAVVSVATADITQATVLPGDAVVRVTAGDGSVKVYTVGFRKNYMSGWDGNGMGTTTDKPGDFGWICTTPVTWTDASDNNDTYAYRYRDNLGVGRVLTHPVNDNVFSYPVTLSSGKIYKFSCSNTNMNGTVSTMFGINTSSDATGTMLKSQSKIAPRWNESTAFDFIFAIKETGTHYVVWKTSNGTDRNIAWDFLITEVGNALAVTFDTDGGSEVDVQYFAEGESYTIEEPAEPVKQGYVFAGWYKDKTYTVPFNFGVPVSGNTTVYACFLPEGSQTQLNVTFENEIVSLQSAKYMNITVRGKSELHILSSAPLVNSNVNLVSDDSWLYLETVKPSTVMSDWLTYIKINGRAVNPEKDRLAIYGSGTVIIPGGKEIAKRALTIYKGENYLGESMQLEYDKYYRNAELGSFDNHIRSFKLKKGYACTFANNPDGTGHSRVFIANDEDLEVSVMPEGLEFASFVRVFRWDWISKKGMCNGGLAGITNSSWYNDWDAGSDTENPDFEYVPMRHNLGWQSFDVINSRKNVSHVLGYNEPDHTDQANCTPEQAIEQWPEFFKSGLRLGSPTPDAIRKQWLVDFLAIADKLNYRVDFVVGHMYWNSQSGANLNNGIVDACTRLYGGRPMWITEWNNGANWTTEWWPTASGPQRDADCNIIYDENGNEIIVNRPLSPENAQKQLDWMKDVLPALDNCPYLERHSLYNWVQDARCVVIGNKLTPAGKHFAEFNSKPAFSKTMEYIHNWKIAPPWVLTELSGDCKSFTLKWYDHNGETGNCYVVEKKAAGDFIPVDTLYAGVDYVYGETAVYTDSLLTVSADYRVRAMSYKNTWSEYSDVVSFVLDPALTVSPVLSGEAISTSILQLSWTKEDNARFYILERSSDGVNFEVIATNLTDTSYEDKQLTESTAYQYKLTAQNTWGSIESNILGLTTKTMETPIAVNGIYVSSGDKRAVLTWDFQYDVQYRVYRSETQNGTYSLIADNVDTTRYTDKGLINGKSYYYKIEAYNPAGSFTHPTVFSAIPRNAQHAYFDLNENTGVKVHDLWGGYHGRLENNTTWVQGRDNTPGLSFNASDKSYVHLGDGIVSELNDFTVTTWANYASISGNSRVFDFGEGTSIFMMLCPKSGSNVRYKITCPAGTYTAEAPYTLPVSEWMYLSITQRGTTFKMYVNGQEIFSDDNATVKPSDMGITTKNYLVRSQWGSDPYSTCVLDEFRIYNRALSVAEINALMNGTEPEPLMAGEISSSGQVCKETPVVLSGTPSRGGAGTVGYQWQFRTEEGNWTNLPEATSESCTHPPLEELTYFKRLTFDDTDTVETNTVRVRVLPSVLYWSKTPEDNNWTNPNNWTDEAGKNLYCYPESCTDVHIPGNSAIYPDLDPSIVLEPACRNITFHFGSEVAKHNYLKYEKAYIHYNFGYYRGNIYRTDGDLHSAAPMERNRWYALSAPLKKIVSGDFSVGGYPNMWQQGFSTTRGYDGTLTGDWYSPVNDNALSLSEMHHAVSIWGAKWLPFVGENKHDSLNAMKGIFEMPYFENPELSSLHRIHTYENGISSFRYYYSDTPDFPFVPDSVKPAGTIARGDEAYRFIVDDLTDYRGESAFRVTVPAGAEIMVGNPFLSSLNFETFYETNKDVLETYYRLYEHPWNTMSSGLGSGLIPSFQAFFVKTKGNVGSTTDLYFPVSASVTRTGLYNLRNSSAGENNLVIAQVKGKIGTPAKISVLLGNNSLVDNVPQLFVSEKNDPDAARIPQLFVKGRDGSKNVIYKEENVSSEIVVILGVRSTAGEEFTLSFEDLNRLSASEISLKDNLTGVVTDLKKTDRYTFIHVPEKEDRFELKISGLLAPTGMESNGFDEESVKVYTYKRNVRIESSRQMKKVSLYNAEGLTVHSEPVSSRFYEKEFPAESGVYIITVEFTTGEKSVKKIVLNK